MSGEIALLSQKIEIYNHSFICFNDIIRKGIEIIKQYCILKISVE